MRCVHTCLPDKTEEALVEEQNQHIGEERFERFLDKGDALPQIGKVAPLPYPGAGRIAVQE